MAVPAGDKKQKKKKKLIQYPEVSSHKRPDFISEGLYCEACQMVVEGAVKKLYGKRREHEVVDVLDGFCKDFDNMI